MDIPNRKDACPALSNVLLAHLLLNNIKWLSETFNELLPGIIIEQKDPIVNYLFHVNNFSRTWN